MSSFARDGSANGSGMFLARPRSHAGGGSYHAPSSGRVNNYKTATARNSRSRPGSNNNSNNNSSRKGRRPPVAAASQTNLNIRHLSLDADEHTLQGVFSIFGAISSHALMRNIHTGESLGTAFVRFETHEEAKAAYDFFHAVDLSEASTRRPAEGEEKEEREEGIRSGGENSDAADGAAPSSLLSLSAFTAALESRGFDAPRVLRQLARVAVQWARKQHDAAPDPLSRRRIMKLFLRNLPLDVSRDDLVVFFAIYGGVAEVSLHKDTMAAAADSNSNSNNSGGGGGGGESAHRRIAFVTFSEEGAAERAADGVHNTQPFPSCNGVPLMVKLAEDLPGKSNNNNNHNSNNNHNNNNSGGSFSMNSNSCGGFHGAGGNFAVSPHHLSTVVASNGPAGPHKCSPTSTATSQGESESLYGCGAAAAPARPLSLGSNSFSQELQHMHTKNTNTNTNMGAHNNFHNIRNTVDDGNMHVCATAAPLAALAPRPTSGCNQKKKNSSSSSSSTGTNTPQRQQRQRLARPAHCGSVIVALDPAFVAADAGVNIERSGASSTAVSPTSTGTGTGRSRMYRNNPYSLTSLRIYTPPVLLE